jgi:hypothetical protein
VEVARLSKAVVKLPILHMHLVIEGGEIDFPIHLPATYLGLKL